MSGGQAIHSLQPPDARANRFSHQAMACTWELWIVHDSATYARQAAQVVFDEIDRLEFELSRFIPTSDVARINAHPPGHPLRIGPDCFECLLLAEQLRVATGGAFDVCVGAWVERSLGRDARSLEPAQPVEAEPPTGSPPAAEPLIRPGFMIDLRSRCVGRTTDDTLVDLGGVGKGFAIDRGVELLREWGVRRALLHSGQSTVYALADEGGPWRLSIRDIDPRATAKPSCHSRPLKLLNQALAGSGRDHHGQHIIDPGSGRPVSDVTAAWALAGRATEADAWSTTLMVLGQAGLTSLPEGISGCVADAQGIFSSPFWPGRASSSED